MTDLKKIVISGISGTYPNCGNLAELSNALFNKTDLITDIPHLKFSVGKIQSVNKFDADFFNITSEHADYMDPLCRILLEKTYEAIVDSGYNPASFKDKRIGVYVANCTSDAEVESSFRTDTKGALICERAQSFLANRISYWLGINGPSCTVNTACSSSLYALEFAYKAIKSGEIEAAIVGGSNLSLAPGMVYLYKNLGITSSRCRSFDNEANGFCRAEAVSSVFLQRAEHARRVYAEVVHVKTNNDGFKKQTILFPSAQMQIKLINEMYAECNISKSQVSWVEAHGTGTRVGDYQEMKSLETLCEGRNEPLLCGCVKSNTGHTEATSGLCSIAKVIIAMETGRIPPNVNFKSPQNGIEALHKNKIKIITETTPWNGGYVAINNFGIGGSNAHLLLKSNPKQIEIPIKDVPYLVLISGRTEDSVTSITNYLKSNPLNVEFVNLLHRIHYPEIPHHVYRGYTIIQNNFALSHSKLNENHKPIWFIYPGMGSQWPSMAKELLQLDHFNRSICECHRIMETKGLNLLEILTSENSNIFKNVLNCFVGITAVMIALTDLLETVEVTADSFIGHSFGEIGCAYADKCLSKQEALYVAYYRGIVSLELGTTKGLMAVIGLGGTEMRQKCPPSIDIACYNSNKSCTISGPKEVVEKLLEQFHSKGIFARAIFSGGIAYHSQYIRDGGPAYENYLNQVISSHKERSKKWISTSSGLNQFKYCSPEYFGHNFLQPVYFENVLQQIPKNAITLEIAPHTVFKTILNETLTKTNVNISLMNKNHSSSLQHLLTSLGSLYINGVNMDVSKLYPPIEYPVSRGTPMISPLVKWNHNHDWYIPFQNRSPETLNTSKGKLIQVSYDKNEFEYLKGSIINGANVFPGCGYLKMVWDAAMEQKDCDLANTSVIFRNVNFYKTLHIPKNESLNFEIIVTRKIGNFEVIFKDEVVCDGYIEIQPTDSTNIGFQFVNEKDALVLQTENIYKELKIKGYSYERDFQSILCSNLEGTNGKIRWTKNWIVFMEALFQFLYFFESDKTSLKTISSIEVVEIDQFHHEKCSQEYENELPITLLHNNIYSGGIRMEGIKTKTIERENCKKPILQTFQFTPYFNSEIISVEKLVQILATILLENISATNLRIAELLSVDSNASILSLEIDKYFKKMPFNRVVVTLHCDDESSPVPSGFKIEKFSEYTQKSVNLLILSIGCENKVTSDALINLQKNAFIITRGNIRNDSFNASCVMVAKYFLRNEKIILWRKKSNYKIRPVALKLDSDSFNWVSKLQSLINDGGTECIILYSEYDHHSGIIGFYKCLKKELKNIDIRCFLILDTKGTPFLPDNLFYQNQIEVGLNVNVFKNGFCGTFVPFEIAYSSSVTVPHVYLEARAGDGVTELDWVQGEINFDIKQKDDDYNQLLFVYYATLPDEYSTNASTVEDNPSPYAFSGKNIYGSNVMGISLSNRVSNLLLNKNTINWNIPNDWSLEEAATLPIAYMIALMILTEAEERKIKSILIQNVSTEIGQAIVNLFSTHKFSIFAFNAENDAKLIENQFPQIRVLDKRSLGLENIDWLILSDFNNCAPLLVRSVVFNGCIFYTGDEKCIKWPVLENAISDGKHFHIRNIQQLIDKQRQKIINLKKLFENKIKSGMITPLTTNKIKAEIPGTVNRMIDVMLHMRPEEHKYNLKITQEAQPKFTCINENVYIICGGLGGMGFELTDWLITRGARKLILVSRTGKCDGYHLRQLAKWQSSGITVKITTDDITTSDGVINLLKCANQMGNVTAIFNTTLILQDALFQNQTPEAFETVANPKAIATIHLDKISRIMCPYLKHFVIFSSIVCGYGNPGQSNYGFANSIAERICELRRSEGLPGQAIEWAGVGDVGYLKNIPANKLPTGTLLQPIRSCLKTLDQVLYRSLSVVSSFVVCDEPSTGEEYSQTGFLKIRKIVDATTTEIHPNTTLKDIGLDSIAVTEAKIVLEQKYNVILNTNDILNLKLKTLWELENTSVYQDTREHISPEILSILEEIYSNVFRIIANEKNPLDLTPIVRLESFLHEGAVNPLSPHEERTIFFLPSVEGFAAVIQSLARNVDLQVLCGQYNLLSYNITEIASTLLREIEPRLESNNTFHLVGHSFGGLIAMEIAHMLEQKGKIGYLYLIDSSPAIVKEISRVLFMSHGFYASILGFMRALKTEINLQQFKETLLRCNDWNSAFKFTMDSLPSDLMINKEYAGAVLTTSYRRNLSINLYEPPKSGIKSKVYFFKPKKSILDLPETHGLNEFCENTVEEYSINGNHFSMLQTTELAHYIMSLYRQNATEDEPTI